MPERVSFHTPSQPHAIWLVAPSQQEVPWSR